MLQTHSELHTHLMGMLSLDGILEILREFKYPGFPVDSEGKLIFKEDANFTRTRKLTDEIVHGLIIPYGENIKYAEMETLYSNRAKLLADIAHYFAKSDTHETQLLNRLYSRFLNLALEELTSEENKVSYVEISFSNQDKIAYMLKHIPEELKKKIDVKFLLCTNRTKSVKSLEKDLSKIRNAIATDQAIGFDFMGKEEPFNNNENDSKKKDSNSMNSFKTKLEAIISVLRDYPKSTLRIHTGENEESRCNPLSTLRMLDKVATQYGIQIPPPEIRLGHAIYFEDCDEYVDLLRKYQCIIEINASSNFALSNISHPNQLSYNYYLDRGIPVVISTDGAGIYDTHMKQENYIAHNVADDEGYLKILTIDKNIRTKKGSR